MREDLKELLSKNNVALELKGYKEMSSRDGYHMRGTIYVNGKKAICCEDLGVGGECDIEILNQTNAKPLLDLESELQKLKAYPGDELIGHLPLGIENIFYDMIEEHLEIKEYKKNAKKNVLVRYTDTEYKKGDYIAFNTNILQSFLTFIVRKMEKEKREEIYIFNISMEWKLYTVAELKEILLTRIMQ